MQDLGTTKTRSGEVLGAIETSLQALLLTYSSGSDETAVTIEVPSEALPWLRGITDRVMSDYRQGSLAGRLRELAAELENAELLALAGYVSRLERGFETLTRQLVADSNGAVVFLEDRRSRATT